jgi:hypothetical protein
MIYNMDGAKQMKKLKIIFTATFSLVLAGMLQACVSAQHLVSMPAEPADVRGTYTLLLYGCHYPDDIKDVAILVDEGSKYPLEIFDLDTSYQAIKGVPAEEALSRADSFVRCSNMHRIWQTQVRRIPDDSGGTIGFEVRPLYFPIEFGSPDVMLISYALKNGTVRAYIKLDPDVERAIESSGSDNRDHSGN